MYDSDIDPDYSSSDPSDSDSQSSDHDSVTSGAINLVLEWGSNFILPDIAKIVIQYLSCPRCETEFLEDEYTSECFMTFCSWRCVSKHSADCRVCLQKECEELQE